jgi:hypothetical protein
LVPDVPSNCFRLVSSTPQNGFIPVFDARKIRRPAASQIGNFGPQDSDADGRREGGFPRAARRENGVKIACLAPLGALR